MEGNVTVSHPEIWLFDLERKALRRTLTEGTSALLVALPLPLPFAWPLPFP